MGGQSPTESRIARALELRLAWVGFAVLAGIVLGGYYLLRPDDSTFIGLLVDVTVLVVVAVLVGVLADRVRRVTGESRAAEDRYRLVADHMPETALALYDRDLRIQLLAGPVLAETDVAREEVEGRTLEEIMPGPRGRWLAELYRSALEGEPRSVEYESADDGRHYWLRTVPIYGEDGSVEAGLAATHDITERVRAESALSAAERRARLTVEHASDAIISMDAEGRITAWNAAAETTFGWTRGEALGAEVAETIIPERFREAHRAGLARFHETGEAPALERRLELAGLHRDGHEFPIELALTELRTGGEVSFDAIVQDISERREAEEEAERISSEFFAQVAHELGTPLTSLAVNLELLAAADGPRLTSEGRSLVEVMDHETRRLERLVRDMRVAAQVKSGRFSISPERVRISSVVAAAVAATRPLALAKSIDVELRIEELPLSAGDPDRIGQAVDNLLSNAIKYTPDGGRVSVSVRRLGDACQIEVSDTGNGIPEQERKRIFRRFERGAAELPGQVFGMGLGLAIAKAIIEAHGGRISLRSEVGSGSTFALELPLEPIAEERSRSDREQAASRLRRMAAR